MYSVNAQSICHAFKKYQTLMMEVENDAHLHSFFLNNTLALYTHTNTNCVAAEHDLCMTVLAYIYVNLPSSFPLFFPPFC